MGREGHGNMARLSLGALVLSTLSDYQQGAWSCGKTQDSLVPEHQVITCFASTLHWLVCEKCPVDQASCPLTADT